MQKEVSVRQQEIMEAAGKIIMDNGIKSLTTKSLAAEIGFSESALYRHFKNKEDIILVLLQSLYTNINERLNAIYNTNNTAEDNLKLLFKSQFSFFKVNPHYVVAILSEGLFDETQSINKAMMNIVNFKAQLIHKIIDEGKQNREFKKTIPTKDLAHIIMGSFRLMILKWKFSNFQIDLVKEGNTIMKHAVELIKNN